MEQSRLPIEIVVPRLSLKREGRPGSSLEPFDDFWVQFGQVARDLR